MKKLYFLFCVVNLAIASLFNPEDQLINSSICLGQNPASPAFYKKSYMNLTSSVCSYLQQNSKKLEGWGYSGEDIQSGKIEHYYLGGNYEFLQNFWVGLQYSFDQVNFDSILFKNELDSKDWYKYSDTAELNRTALNFSWLFSPDLALGLSFVSNYVAQHYNFYYSTTTQELYDLPKETKSYSNTRPYGAVVIGLIKQINDLLSVSLAQQINYDTIYSHYYDDEDDIYIDTTGELANVTGLGIVLHSDPLFSLAATVEWSHELIYTNDYYSSEDSTTDYYHIRRFPYNTYGLAFDWNISPQLEWQLFEDIVRYYSRNENMDLEIQSYGLQINNLGTSFSFSFSENQKIQMGLLKSVRIAETTAKGIISNTSLYGSYSCYFSMANDEQKTVTEQSVFLRKEPTHSIEEKTTTINIVAPVTTSVNTVDNKSAEVLSDIIYKLSATELVRGEKLDIHIIFKKGQQMENGFFILADLPPRKFSMMGSWFYTAEIDIPADMPVGQTRLRVVLMVDGQTVEKEFELKIK